MNSKRHPSSYFLLFCMALFANAARGQPLSTFTSGESAFWRGPTGSSDPPPIRLVLIGDCTIADGTGWGQAIYGYLKSTVQTVNYGMPWFSTKVFLASAEKDKMLLVKPDYVLVQFGLMDVVECGGVPDRCFTTLQEYEDNLKTIVQAIRGFNGTPILITPPAARYWDAKGKISQVPWALDRYVVVKKVASELQTHLIDLNQLSVDLYNELGENGSAFFFPVPGDTIHYTMEGAEVMSGLVVNALPDSFAPYLVVEPVKITAQPQSQSVITGTTVAFSVSATGTAPLKFQWQYYGADLPGATNATLTLANVTATQAGVYLVRVKNPAGEKTSAPAVLSVRVPEPLDRWTIRSSGTTLSLADVAYGCNRFVAVGSGLLLTSPDGADWVPNPQSTNNLSRVLYRNNAFVALEIGSGPLQGGALLTSPDGLGWTRCNVNLPTAEYAWFTSLSYASQLWALSVSMIIDIEGGVGDNFLMTSPDGSTWTRSTEAGGPPDDGSYAYGLACGKKTFVSVGNNGTIRTSPDQINWTPRVSGTENALRGVAFGMDTFVAVGDQGTILQSAPLAPILTPPVLTGGLSNGCFELTITGPAAQSYVVQSMDELSASVTWQARATLTLTNGAFAWRDPSATNGRQRFYRVVFRP